MFLITLPSLENYPVATSKYCLLHGEVDFLNRLIITTYSYGTEQTLDLMFLDI